MSAVAGRDYLSGLLESFTRLYDGQPETRILRREKIEIKHPYLIFMSGGIKSKMEEIVGMEHIRSGFLPRFIFVTGSTTRDQVRPIGPPDSRELAGDGTAPRDEIVNELWGINQYYGTPSDDNNSTPVIKIAGIVKVASAPTPKHVRMTGTPEFWKRLVTLNEDAIEMGETSSQPELYTPLYTRLSNSILKVAMLLAGAERSDIVHLHHLQKAISLAQEWVETVTEFALAIEQQPEMDRWEKKAEKIINWVKAQDPKPITQTEIMQKFRIRKRDIDDIEATLMARSSIEISPYPHSKNTKGTDILFSVSGRAHALNGRPRSKIEREDTFHATSEGHPENGRRIRFPQGSE
jgi:hypothetical protein